MERQRRTDREAKDLQDAGVKSSETIADSIGVSVNAQNGWSPNELQLLVKAVNIYQAGTTDRWKLIAQYVTLHGGTQRNEKETIKQAKEMKSADSTSTDAIKIKESEAILAEIKPSAKDSSRPDKDVVTWTAQQQKQLETALQSSVLSTDPQRWEKIASCVEGKSKKECMRRYKELVEIVRARNARKE